LSVEVIPEQGDNLEEFALSSGEPTKKLFVPPGRYAVIARRPNGERLYRSVEVAKNKPATVNLAEGLLPAPDKFMLNEMARGEIAGGAQVGKDREPIGVLRGFAGQVLRSITATSQATKSVLAPASRIWSLHTWDVRDGALQSSAPAKISFDGRSSFLKIEPQANCCAVGLLNEKGFGPIIMSPPFRRPLHITFLAQGLVARAAARYSNPSGYRAPVALASPTDAAVSDLLTALGSTSVEHTTSLWEQNHNAIGYVAGKFSHPAEALLGAHYLLRFLPDQLPLAWADNLGRAFPAAADGPVIAAWLRLLSRSEEVLKIKPDVLEQQVRQQLEQALSRQVALFARTRRLLVDGMRFLSGSPNLEILQKEHRDPATYLNYGAHAGGLEAFWGTNPLAPGTKASPDAQSDVVATIVLEGAVFSELQLGDARRRSVSSRRPRPAQRRRRPSSARRPAGRKKVGPARKADPKKKEQVAKASSGRGSADKAKRKRVPAKKRVAAAKKRMSGKKAAKRQSRSSRKGATRAKRQSRSRRKGATRKSVP
jgi:hypothetical protein